MKPNKYIKLPQHNNREYTDSWIIRGIYYGYPACCIRRFLKGIPTAEQKQAANGTGFVPCEKHAKEILAGKITLNSLITNRFHSKEFPEDS